MNNSSQILIKSPLFYDIFQIYSVKGYIIHFHILNLHTKITSYILGPIRITWYFILALLKWGGLQPTSPICEVLA